MGQVVNALVRPAPIVGQSLNNPQYARRQDIRAGRKDGRQLKAQETQPLAHRDTALQACERLKTVTGIGPIISNAMVAAIGNGAVFTKGRDFGDWLELVPKQISTGHRTIPGTISRRGHRYLRARFVRVA